MCADTTFWRRALRRAVLLLAVALPAHAALVEQVIEVPVKVTNAYGRVVEQPIVVSVYHDSTSPVPRPIALINHGRAADAAQRAAFGRATAITNARWLAGLGLLVVVPTRLGYGVSGGEDVEDTGPCARKRYPPGYEAAAVQTLQVLDQVRQRPDVQADRVLVLGQSFGGATAIAVAAKGAPGIVAAINFAGGGGGNPLTQPQQPCDTPGLRDLFAGYGRTARIPTLWVYAENDQWMGPVYPRQWFDAFQAAGGVGEFVLFPPNGKDGHGLFTQDPSAWRPTVLDFLRKHMDPGLATKGAEKR
ncbi:MAG: dienelactone hydrolase family protein [Betaproteobacteria bacterium]|jgi:dienelactone hydrolase